jgi:UDP-glucuronate 4-epimerase
LWTAHPDPATSFAPYRVYNIGNNQPVELMHLIHVLEKNLGKTAVKQMLPMQPGDVPATFADVDDLIADVGFQPRTGIDDGVERFVKMVPGISWSEGKEVRVEIRDREMWYQLPPRGRT